MIRPALTQRPAPGPTATVPRPLHLSHIIRLWLVASLLGALPAIAQTTRTWVGPIAGQWSTPANWSPTGVPENDDTIVVTNGFIVLTNQVNIQGTFNWSGGTLAGSPLRIEPSGVLNIDSPSLVLLQTSLINEGRVRWLRGLIGPVCAGFGPIINQPGALWDIQCDVSQQGCVGSTNNFFLNRGTLRKTGSPGTTAWNIPVRNAGRVLVLEGTLWLQGSGAIDGTYEAAAGATLQFGTGSFTYNNPPALIGAGRFQFVSGTLRLLENLIPRLEIVGGVLDLGPEFQGGSITNLSLRGGTLIGATRVTGFFDWAGASVASPLRVEPGATVNWSAGTAFAPITIAEDAVLNLASPTTVSLQSALTNAGTLNWWSGSVSLNCATFGPIVNRPEGLWDIHGDATLDACGGTNAYFLNQGLLRKSGSLGTTLWGLPLINQGAVAILQGSFRHQGGGPLDGTYTVAADASLQLATRAFNYSAPPEFSGPGTVEFVSGILTLTDDIIPNLSLAGGTITLGAGFQGGAIANLTLGPGVTLGGTNRVSGVFHWAGASVAGPLQVSPNATVHWSAGAALAPITIASNGVLNIDSPTGVTLQAALTNAGTVNWRQGSLSPSCAGFGPIVNRPGALWDIQCDAPLGSCGANPNGYFLNAGTLRKSAGPGTTDWSHPLHNPGLVTIEQGTLRHQGGGPIEGRHELAAGTRIEFATRPFNAGASAIFIGPGSARFTSGSLTLTDDLPPGLALSGGTISLGPTFQGGAITNLTLGPGTTLASTLPVTGSLEINGATVSSRLIIADNGHVLWTAGTAAGGVSVSSQGRLEVSTDGTVASLGTLTNRGTMTVQRGTLALNGGFAPHDGTVRFGLSGPNSFGRIAVAGSTTLSGSAEVFWRNDFVPSAGQTFPLLTCGARSGTFAALTVPPSAQWQPGYSATTFSMTVTAIPRLSFAPGPASTTAGEPLAPVIVQLLGSDGAPAAVSGVAVTLGLATGTGPLLGSLTQATDETGRATFPSLSLTNAGQKTLVATAVPAGVSPVTSGPFTIAPAPPDRLALATPITSPQAAGASFTPAPVLRVLDRFGNVALSPATVRVRLEPGPGGRLAGMTNVTVTGQASFNLSYHPADPDTAETFTAIFESAGLAPAINRPVLAAFVATNVVIQDGNSLLRIDPTTPAGLHRWTINGVSQLHQRWYWLRPDPATGLRSLDRFGPAWMLTRHPNLATLVFTHGPLRITSAFQLQGGPPGSPQAELTETFTLENTGTTAAMVDWIAYADFDLNEEPSPNSVSRPTETSFLQSGPDVRVTATATDSTPSHWEMGPHGPTLQSLANPGLTELSDRALSQDPGDQSFAWQWSVNLGPGQSRSLSISSVIAANAASPVPRPPPPPDIPLSITRSGSQVLLSWPTNQAKGFVLESAPSPRQDNAWTPLTNTPVAAGHEFQITLPRLDEDRFFRLRR